MRILLFGTFDGLHPGHRFLLDEAQKRGGDVTVVVARDSNVKKIKGHLPENYEVERQKALKKAFPFFEVLLGDEQDFLFPVRLIQPDLILLGYDQKLPPGVKQEDLHCKVERLPPFEPHKYKSSLFRSKGKEIKTGGKNM